MIRGLPTLGSQKIKELADSACFQEVGTWKTILDLKEAYLRKFGGSGDQNRLRKILKSQTLIATQIKQHIQLDILGFLADVQGPLEIKSLFKSSGLFLYSESNEVEAITHYQSELKRVKVRTQGLPSFYH